MILDIYTIGTAILGCAGFIIVGFTWFVAANEYFDIKRGDAYMTTFKTHERLARYALGVPAVAIAVIALWPLVLPAALLVLVTHLLRMANFPVSRRKLVDQRYMLRLERELELDPEHPKGCSCLSCYALRVNRGKDHPYL